MLGSGVGFNIQRHNVYELPRVKDKINIKRLDTKDADFIVPDSREGWVKLLAKVLKAHFYGGKGFTYSTINIRGKGAPIKSFGGTASGPEELCWGINEIHSLLNKRAGKKVRPIDCLDIMNIIGAIVVAGNVRRSAQIAIGDPDDVDYLKAKRWDLGPIPNWRNNSNNSVAASSLSELHPLFWETYNQGEPYGLINLYSSRKYGRLGDTRYTDPKVEGYNPCKPLNSLILTKDGYITFEQALQKDSLIVKGLNGWVSATKPFKTGENRTVSRLLLSNGSYLYGTSNHLHMTSEGEWKKLEDLEIGEQLKWNNEKIYDLEIEPNQDYLDGCFAGWVQGDGWFSKRKDNVGHNVGMCFGVNEIDVIAFFEDMLKVKTKPHEQKPHTCSYFSSHKKELANKLLAFGMPVDKNDLTWLYGKSKEFKLGFIKAIFTADGSVRKNNNVELYSTKRHILEVIFNILNEFGIYNTITVHANKTTYTAVDGLVRNNSTCYKINIYAGQFKKIGFLSKFKNDLVQKQVEKPIYRYKDYVTILDIETEYSVEDVYDITVDDENHAFYDTGVVTHNCAEQSLEDKETCCLAEIFLPNISSLEELKEVASYLYRINKHSLALPCHLKETEAIVHKNMRMGIGITGTFQATEEQRSWLRDCYEFLREYDEIYSKKHNFPISIKLTTSKPSGTLSLLAGVTPGANVNPAGPYYLRRVRMAVDSPLLKQCEKNGYPVEWLRKFDGTNDYTTKVVTFPCSVPETTPIAETTTAVQQLEFIKWVQENWSDNAVSVTVTYKKEELEEIKAWLAENYTENVKSVSFLLYAGHGFDQAPYETITKEEFQKLKDSVIPITYLDKVSESSMNDIDECAGGACPVK
jgi:ribonucleotide reductase alpha subunit